MPSPFGPAAASSTLQKPVARQDPPATERDPAAASPPTGPAPPQEQPETDAATSHQNDPLEEQQQAEDFFASGEEVGAFSPDTPLPNRGGEEGDEFFATGPLEELLEQMEARQLLRAKQEADARREQERQQAERAERMGRPPALDELNRKLILKLITAGMSRRQAAKHVGINHSTITNEAKRNQRFANELREAEMQREYEPLASILAARERSWKAAAWILERTQAERYAKRIYTQPAPEELYKALTQFAELIAQHLELDDTARDQLSSLAEALSRQNLAEARDILRTEALPAPVDSPVTGETPHAASD